MNHTHSYTKEQNNKWIIYQVFTRLFGNRNQTCRENGTLVENGCGKMNDFDASVLRRIHEMGFTHIWFTGIIRHATCTDYSQYGIPKQHASVIKGLAGSPYAIADYYDIDPDLAVDVEHRMEEWEQLIIRTHKAGLGVVMDFVPNHVAREYHSIYDSEGNRELGANDNPQMHFSAQNNFYYCVNEPFNPSFDIADYQEFPAKVTGNDRFDAHPSRNDWYETVKLNYGIDYCDAGGRSEHFDPVPNTWKKMTDILLFWAKKGVDAFRCDMAEMVPTAFWHYATREIKLRYPSIRFIGEVYNPGQYRNYIQAGFDFLYDKVGMYDCMRDVICGYRPASSITYEWQATDDIRQHMLYFLENHDEQRIASDFFCGDARKALPAVIVNVLMQQNPFMLYAGQEYGERGMDKEGFSGIDGRTTIFDYWCVDAIRRGYFDRRRLTRDERSLEAAYSRILRLANEEVAIRNGIFFDLMYVNPLSSYFDPSRYYTFLRKAGDDLLLVVANFSDREEHIQICIPEHAFEFLEIPDSYTIGKDVVGTDLLTGEQITVKLQKNGKLGLTLFPFNGRVIKFSVAMNDNEYVLNEHHKEEFPPAHTAEHLLNQVMIRMFGCERSNNAHIERKKSKISYILDRKPDRRVEREIERRMNDLIEEDLNVTFEYVSRNELPKDIDASKLPEDASDTIRLVRIGNFDVCPCIGRHVRSTSQIGKFELLGTNWNEDEKSYRIRFKIIQ